MIFVPVLAVSHSLRLIHLSIRPKPATARNSQHAAEAAGWLPPGWSSPASWAHCTAPSADTCGYCGSGRWSSACTAAHTQCVRWWASWAVPDCFGRVLLSAHADRFLPWAERFCHQGHDLIKLCGAHARVLQQRVILRSDIPPAPGSGPARAFPEGWDGWMLLVSFFWIRIGFLFL